MSGWHLWLRSAHWMAEHSTGEPYTGNRERDRRQGSDDRNQAGAGPWRIPHDRDAGARIKDTRSYCILQLDNVENHDATRSQVEPIQRQHGPGRRAFAYSAIGSGQYGTAKCKPTRAEAHPHG
jgi:hypothetical protein